MTSASLAAIYDFELYPYALGDVLTWNVRTAMRCEEANRERVDVYICADERFPAGIYQRGLVNTDNFEMFFSELYGAFGTHPRLGDIHVYRDRNSLLERLLELARTDPADREAVLDYLDVLRYRIEEGDADAPKPSVPVRLWGKLSPGSRLSRISRPKLVRDEAALNEADLNSYFIKYIHSHEAINDFAAKYGRIPLLGPSPGCGPDIDEVVAQRLAGRRIVPFHLRLRRLDAGYGGDHSYPRDSDFLAWYDFLREAGSRYPDVVFVALGRLQEKPLELLRLPNVISLRLFGLGLGHELTLMARSSLFIGTSSGFAAYANFSTMPYFITRMNAGACHAYAIAEGAERLPFARENQHLVYEPETAEMLMRLLERGIGPAVTQPVGDLLPMPSAGAVDVKSWLAARAKPGHAASTTRRFQDGDDYRLAETAFLVLPAIERARQALLGGRTDEAYSTLDRVRSCFPELADSFPPLLTMLGSIGVVRGDPGLLGQAVERLCILGLSAGEEACLLGACLRAWSVGHEEAAQRVADLRTWLGGVDFGTLSP